MAIDTSITLGACVDPGQTQKMSFSPQGKATRVLVANSEVPVVYDYVRPYYDEGNRPWITEYFIEGDRVKFNIMFVADSSGDLQDKFFTITLDKNVKKYDIIYSVDGADTTNTTNTKVVINIVTDDTANSVALKTAAMIDSIIRDINVTANENIISFCNYFVGAEVEPAMNNTGFTLSDFEQGSNGKAVAKKRLVYTDTTSTCVLYSDTVIYDF